MNNNDLLLLSYDTSTAMPKKTSNLFLIHFLNSSSWLLKIFYNHIFSDIGLSDSTEWYKFECMHGDPENCKRSKNS